MAEAEHLAFRNGDFLPAAELSLAINDAGFVWGATVTDLCRTFAGRLYRWEDHLGRFRRSCAAAGIGLRFSDAEIAAAAEKLVQHNRTAEQELILVLLATPGLIPYYRGEEGSIGRDGPTFIMHTFPLPFARYRHLFEQGARLVVPEVRHVPAACVDPRIKQRSRMHWWLAEQEVHRVDPSASALLLNEQGFVTETATSNFLMVSGGTVAAPPRAFVLEGVSLQVVRELCAELSVPFVERPFAVEECLRCEEAMLTSTPFCLAGVRSINGQDLPWPGAIFKRLLKAWSAKLGVDIAGTASRTA